MFDILTIIPGKKKHTSSGWTSFNAVCCHHRGHKSDARKRGGIRIEDDDWSYHCFNCDFKCAFKLGKSIGSNTRKLLSWCGIEDAQISKWSMESLQKRDLLDFIKVRKEKRKVKFKETTLPDGELLDIDNLNHHKFIEYLAHRNIDYKDYPFMVTLDDSGRNSNRIVIPYTFEGKIVGHTSRYLDNRTPKYIKEQQPGYVFGYDFQKPEYEICIVVEGIFDALSINACALTHDTISDEQAEILRRLNRKIIVVPDMDKTGLTIIDRAIELGFHVSLPEWDNDVKDTNDAVVKYGKIPTLLSIIQNATTSKVKLEIKRKRLAKRI